MKTLTDFTEQAMLLRERFDDAAKAEGRPTWSPEQIMQGFVGDVGDLMKLVMAKSGTRTIANTNEKLAHELADCLWSVLVLAGIYDVDLGQAFTKMVDETSTKLRSPRPASSANLDPESPAPQDRVT